MRRMDTITLIVSIFVAAVGLVTAVITYLNLKAMTEVTLYLNAVTVQDVIEQNNYSFYPDRIKNTFLSNGMTMPPPYPTPIRWFDLNLGNTGPGIALIDEWSVDYDPKANDSSEMKGNNRLVLGPQSLLTVVGYLPRDYSISRAGSQAIIYQYMGKLPNKAGIFPWKIEVIYRKKLVNLGKYKYKIIFEVSSNGLVKSGEPEKMQC